MEPNVDKLFAKSRSDGTIYGGKIFIGLAQNIALVYDHRVTYYNGQRNHSIRVETMVTF